jgi:hypothetical protein
VHENVQSEVSVFRTRFKPATYKLNVTFRFNLLVLVAYSQDVLQIIATTLQLAHTSETASY